MPQLKKVALAMGNHLAYADTYDQALAQLINQNANPANAPQQTQTPVTIGAAGPVTPQPTQVPRNEDTIRQIRDHFARYRDLTSQGKYAEAGKEMEAIQKLLNQ
jgi:hypothetical protein